MNIEPAVLRKKFEEWSRLGAFPDACVRRGNSIQPIPFDVNHSRRDWLLAPRRPTCVGPRPDKTEVDRYCAVYVL